MARRRNPRVLMGNHLQRPSRRNIFRSIYRNPNWKCLLSTILVHLCIAYATWCHIHHTAYAAQLTFTYTHGSCAQGYSFIPIIFGIMLYSVYMMECWHMRSKCTKIKQESVGEAMKRVRKMRISMPVVWWKSVCYHYVRRTKQVTRYRNGNVVAAQQVYYERVNSHNAGNIFLYDECGMRDISPNLVDLDQFPLTQIRFTKGFVFANTQSANEFEEQRSRFFGENEIRDDYMEVREGLEFADIAFAEDLLVYSGTGLPWWASPAIFWLLSAVLLSWPLRIFKDWRSASIHYQVTKLFGTNYLSPSSVNYTGPLTRTSSLDSRELEEALTGDYLVVPSYSEAILMDPVGIEEQRSPLTGRRRNNQHLNNEHIMFANYGATGRIMQPRYELNDPNPRRNNPAAPQRVNKMMQRARRSISMNMFPGARTKRFTGNFSTSAGPVPRVGPPPTAAQCSSYSNNPMRPPPRSISIPGISSTSWSGSRRDEYSELRPLIEIPLDEPPPPYELALRMCAPLYSRLMRSASSLTSRLLSHSNSREFSHPPPLEQLRNNWSQSNNQPCSSRDYEQF